MRFPIFYRIFVDNGIKPGLKSLIMPIIKRQMLGAQVYQALKEMISNYRFKPGGRLNLDQLARELQVSRTPVCEAVRRLEQEGLLETIPNRGVFMTEMTPEMGFAMYQVREVLEGLAGRLAANKISDEAIEDLEECLNSQLPVVNNGDLTAYSQLDFEFHAIIYRQTGNPVLQEMLESIKNRMRPIVLLTKPILSRLWEDHKEILDALKSRDAERTQEAFMRHNRKMQEQIESEIREGRG